MKEPLIQVPMRRKDKALGQDISLSILRQATYGVLGSCSHNQPLATPLNFALQEEPLALIFHVALEGQKLDNLYLNPKACFTVVENTKVLASEFSMAYQSVMAFGQVEIVTDSAEKTACLLQIAQKYSPSFMEEAKLYAQRALENLLVLRLNIEYFTGKVQS